MTCGPWVCDHARMVEIERMQPDDWPAVRSVYAEGIATGQATFEERPPAWEEWDAEHLAECRLVARRDGEVVAWAALAPVSRRHVYRGVAEVSMYVAAAERGSGAGRALGQALVEASERAGIWTLEGWIFPENEASVALCESFGCRVVGVRERLGKMGDRWRDVLLVERRSPTVG
jgi:L-amino acid N-acyltransferase YncA